MKTVVKNSKNRRKKYAVLIISVICTFSLLVGGCILYVNDYYRADTEAIGKFAENVKVEVNTVADGVVAYGREDAPYGFIFYPGGKVEYTAYDPLMRQLASMDVLCVLLEMPCNLAVLDMNRADGICEMFPKIEKWFIGGHSLGGSMAAFYINENYNLFEGLVLLGAYSSKDLSDKDISVLSVFGSEDMVMNKEKYFKYKNNLPNSFTEYEIEGGCHAYFGMYGEQKGDGDARISVNEQICRTAVYIYGFMKLR